MHRYHWAPLNRQQIGTFAEYFVKMEFTMHGFQVFKPEVDDRGVDFIARFAGGRWLEVQVKSVRQSTYVFMSKDKFIPSSTLYAAVALFTEGQLPDLYLIPSVAWQRPTALLVDRTYAGRESPPEWGVNLSKKNRPLLDEFRFDTVVDKLLAEKTAQ